MTIIISYNSACPYFYIKPFSCSHIISRMCGQVRLSTCFSRIERVFAQILTTKNCISFFLFFLSVFDPPCRV